MNGIINVYKERGYTSFDVCAKLRRILKQKKIGHTGTLDPDAEGVLPVCIGNATKLCDMLTDKDKTYEAVLLLGVTTDTQDITGSILKEIPVTAKEEDVRQVIDSFVGTYDQIPPMYSAIKVNGKRLYELARQGQVIERKARTVTIYSIDILSMECDENHPNAIKEVRMRVTCSKGTYIRSLCEDIGQKLGFGGCMKSLLRTKVSIFDIKESLRLSDIERLVNEERIDSVLMAPDSLFMNYGEIILKKEFDSLLYNGNQLFPKHIENNNNVQNPSAQIEKEQEIITDNEKQEYSADYSNKESFYRAYDSNHQFWGIYQYMELGWFHPVKMFIN